MLKDLTIFNMASASMQHASKRHGLIASNIANADTPNYVSKDLVAFDPSEMMLNNPTATRASHLNFAESLDPYSSLNRSVSQSAFDQTLNKNKISVEEEMAKAAQSQSSYDLSSAIWRKSIGLFMSVVSPRG